MFFTRVKGAFLKIVIHSSVRSAMCFLVWASAICRNHGTNASRITNLAQNKPAFQGPGTLGSCFPGNGVDGLTGLHYTQCTHTYWNSDPKWWMVDLQDRHWIHEVSLLNRGDCCTYRLQNFTVDMFAEDPREVSGFPKNLGEICGHRTPEVPGSQWANLLCNPRPLIGQFLRVVKWGYDALTLCEVKIMGYKCPPMFVRRFEQIDSKKPLTEPAEYLGEFSGPMQCALELHGQLHINVYLYNSQNGSCKGYADPTWSETLDEQWEAYREVV